MPRVSRLTAAVVILLIASSKVGLCQLLECQTIQGDWYNYGNGQEFTLTQTGQNVTGSMTWLSCEGNQVWPISGTAGSGTFSFVATNNGCTNFFGGATATFSGDIGQPGCNYLYGSQTNANGEWYAIGIDNPYPTTEEPITYDFVAAPVDVPDYDTSVSPPGGAWEPDHGAPWNQTLAGTLSPSEFEGRGVYEYSQGVGVDSCWFTTSKYPPFNSITTPGFLWYVSSKNGWGADWIGYSKLQVEYYRAKNRVPCGTSFTQIMVIDAAYDPDNTPAYGSYLDENGDIFYGVPYETNTLGGNIAAAEAQSIRNSQQSTNTSW